MLYAETPSDVLSLADIHPELEAVFLPPLPQSLFPIPPCAFKKEKSWTEFPQFNKTQASDILAVPSPAPPYNLEEDRASVAPLIEAAVAELAPSSAGVSRSAISVPSRDKGRDIPVRVWAPEASEATEKGKRDDGKPVVVTLHGGGWILGTPELDEPMNRMLVQEHKCVCVGVDYRLAPEHKWPAAVEDCWDVITWLSKHAHTVGGDLTKGFIVAGSSAGANLADVVGHMARDKELTPPLTGLYESIPALITSDAIPERFRARFLSHEQCKDVAFAPESVHLMVLDLYGANVHSPLFAPLLHPNGHAGLPPVVFQVCGMDIMRDDALIYENVLRTEAGVKTRLYIYKGLPHAFFMALPQLNVSKEYMREAVEGIGWLLTQP